jgi:predicted SnoaL-like aldol condensation-catalyzing enzyme
MIFRKPKSDTDEPVPGIYKWWAPRARYFKALIQMVIGIVAAALVLAIGIRLGLHHHSGKNIQNHVFNTIGVSLAVAAGVELAYTLFTHGPDEALDPLMLGLSAAIILQLAKIEELDLKQAASAVVYVIALGITFAIREYLAKEPEFKDWSPPWPWKKHKRHRLLRTFYRLIDEKQWDQAAEMLTDDCRSHILANEVVVAGSVVGPQTMSQWFSDNLNHVQTQREIQRIKDDGPASVVFTRVTVTSADGKSKSNSAWVDVFRFNGSLIAEHVGLPSH